MRKTLKKILAEYGAIAVVLYLSIFFAVFVGAYFAIRLGWAPESVAGIAGAWTAVFARQGGRWVVIQEHLSDVPAAEASAGEQDHSGH